MRFFPLRSNSSEKLNFIPLNPWKGLPICPATLIDALSQLLNRFMLSLNSILASVMSTDVSTVFPNNLTAHAPFRPGGVSVACRNDIGMSIFQNGPWVVSFRLRVISKNPPTRIGGNSSS